MGQLLYLLNQQPLKIAALEQIYCAWKQKPAFDSELITATRQLEPELAYRPIWLLRRRAREARIEDGALERMAAISGELTHWIARLCLCQLFAQTGTPFQVREELYPFFVDCFADRRPIIRAWAITCLLPMREDPEYYGEIEAMLRRAMRDPAKSVRARLRRLGVMETPDNSRRKARSQGHR